MITVIQAKERINQATKTLKSIEINLSDGLNKIISEDIISPINMPPFDQSAMDGYALGDIASESYQVIGEIKAGDNPKDLTLSKGQAIRIFTGAVVPNGAIAIAQQEIVARIDDSIKLTATLVEHKNIRPKRRTNYRRSIGFRKRNINNTCHHWFFIWHRNRQSQCLLFTESGHYCNGK